MITESNYSSRSSFLIFVYVTMSPQTWWVKTKDFYQLTVSVAQESDPYLGPLLKSLTCGSEGIGWGRDSGLIQRLN